MMDPVHVTYVEPLVRSPAPLGAAHPPTGRWRRTSRAALRFAVVGAAGAVVNTVMLQVLYGAVRLPLLLASGLATEVAVGHNYLVNGWWTFRGERSWSGLAKFNLGALVGLAVTVLMVWLLVGAGLAYLAANLVAIAAGATLNFAVSARWVWPGRIR